MYAEVAVEIYQECVIHAYGVWKIVTEFGLKQSVVLFMGHRAILG